MLGLSRDKRIIEWFYCFTMTLANRADCDLFLVVTAINNCLLRK